MATLQQLLTPKPGDPAIAGLRNYLTEQMAQAQAEIMQQEAMIAFWQTLDEDDAERVGGVAKCKRTQVAYLAKYNDLEARKKALPKDEASPKAKAGTQPAGS